MKKILTASLVAIMAVTAARADIASTDYVDKAQTAAEKVATDLNTAMNTRVQSLEGDNTTNKTDIKNLQDTVAGLTDGGEGSVATQISTAIGELADGATDVAAAIANAQAAATNAAAQDATTKANQAVTDAKTETTNQINALDVTDTAVTGSYVSAVSETDGKVTISRTEFDKIIGNDTTATSLNAPTAYAVKSYIDGRVGDLGDRNDLNEANIAQNQGDIENLYKIKADKATTLAGYGIGDAYTKTETDAKIDGAQTALSNAKTELQGQIDAVKSGSSLAANAVKTENIASGAVTEAQLSASVNASLDLADSALQKADIVTGTANGTISVEGTDVAVKGLGSAAYTESGAYATAAQGIKADDAMNWETLKKDASWTEAGCGTEGTKCSLTANGGKIAWEKIAE